jgi:hypothetical protein
LPPIATVETKRSSLLRKDSAVAGIRANERWRVPAGTGEVRSPGTRFRAIDLLLTNFQLPRSTLFILVAALAGLDGRALRFFSDGCHLPDQTAGLILRCA